MRGNPKLLTPSAEELRERYGELIYAKQIIEAAGLRIGNAAYKLALKRMEGREPAERGMDGQRLWTPEQVAAALWDWAEAHKPKPKKPKPKIVQKRKPTMPKSDGREPRAAAARCVRCESCRYAWESGIGDNGKLWVCLYILAEERRRPCPARCCTVYTER